MTKKEILRLIRNRCKDCIVEGNPTSKCKITTCGLYPYRSGKDSEPDKSRVDRVFNIKRMKAIQN